MIKDIKELYTLLYYLNESNSVTEVSDKLYWTLSKTSRKIKEYEQSLGFALTCKNDKSMLSGDGVKLLKQIREPYFELVDILNFNQTKSKTGLDENLITSLSDNFNNYIAANSHELIRQYNLGEINEIIISSDYQEQINFKNREFYTSLDVYKIKHRDCKSDKVFGNDQSCPIAKKLILNNIKLDTVVSQSLSICNLVKAQEGSGYTFTTLTLNEEIDIEVIPQLKVDFYKYSRK